MTTNALDVREIVDTTRIDEKLYYEFKEILQGYESPHSTFLRTDSEHQVWQLNEKDSTEFLTYLRFDAKPGLVRTNYDSTNNLTYSIFLTDTNRVESTPAGRFENCFYFLTKIEETQNEFGEAYAPDIGLIANDFEPGGTVLKGAFVNGIVYGDTTTLISSVNEIIDTKPISQVFTFPNPFNSRATITYHLSKLSRVSLKIFTITGQNIQTVLSETQEPGDYTIYWEPVNLSSGVYLLNFQNNDFCEITKLLYLR